jgi:hypothetical protein
MTCTSRFSTRKFARKVDRLDPIDRPAAQQRKSIRIIARNDVSVRIVALRPDQRVRPARVDLLHDDDVGRVFVQPREHARGIVVGEPDVDGGHAQRRAFAGFGRRHPDVRRTQGGGIQEQHHCRDEGVRPAPPAIRNPQQQHAHGSELPSEVREQFEGPAARCERGHCRRGGSDADAEREPGPGGQGPS